MTVKSRFAPSPTGYLHVGSVRTALYCYLFAHKNSGKYLLRIEDTDQERSTQEATDVILSGLSWLGLEWDEGPIYQTHRLDRYRELIDELLAKGLAYRCTCSEERLARLRHDLIANKQTARYDGHCRDKDLPADCGRHVIRFKTPLTGVVEFTDEIRKVVRVENGELDDFIILRSDGYPTYNFTVVVDDADMGVTDVIRGEDHISNTPKQINIFQALGYKVPNFAHIPMILGSDGKRLSKRHGAVNILQYKDQGYLPEALLNYLVRLGWSHGDQEIFTLQEMRDLFSLEHVHKSAAVFDVEKLNWLNHEHLKLLSAVEVAKRLPEYYQSVGIDTNSGPDLELIAELFKGRSTTLVDLVSQSEFCFASTIEYDQDAIDKHVTDVTKDILSSILCDLESLKSWQLSEIKSLLKQVVKAYGVKFPAVAQPLRIAITGNISSPSIDAILEILGKDISLKRISAFAQTL